MGRFTYDGHNFYHGTSTIFLDSIRKTGLGAINPSVDLKLLDVVKYLYKKAKLANVQDLQLFTWENSIKATIAQTELLLNGQTLNFRHDSMYVSASHVRAAMYAGLNKYGSEMLEKCIGLLEILDRHSINVKIPTEIDVFGVRNYLNAKPTPIIVEVLEIADEELDE